MTKKTIPAALACVIAFSMLTACSSGAAVSSSSEAASSESVSAESAEDAVYTWDRNPTEHWKTNEKGETFDFGEHTLTDIACAVCGSEIWEYDDSTEIYDYNENGDCIRYSVYDSDDNLVDDLLWVYEYDANGSYDKVSHYYNDMLSEEVDYELDADGNILTITASAYYEDGSYTVGEFTPFYEPLVTYEYAPDGAEKYRYTYEYAEKDGVEYLAKSCDYTDGVLTLVQEYNEYGDGILFREVDENGNTVSEMSHEYTYNDNGERETLKFYVDGRLVQESFYATVDGEVLETSMIYHNEDGSKEISEYNEYGDAVKIALYDASDAFIGEYTYEIEYDEEGNILLQKTYLDGALTEEQIYIIEEGEDFSFHYIGKVITYDEDGSKCVTEQNRYDDITQITYYDAAGTVIDACTYENEYAEDDLLMAQRIYRGDVLEVEILYALEEHEDYNFYYLASETTYHEDGTKTVVEFNTDGEIIKETAYDASGKIVE